MLCRGCRSYVQNPSHPRNNAAVSARNPLGASSADSLSGGKHISHTSDTAVGQDTASGSEAEVGELAAHARVVLRSAADLGGRGEDAGVLLVSMLENLFSQGNSRFRGVQWAGGSYAADGDGVNLGAFSLARDGGAGRGDGGEGGDDEGGELHFGG